MLILVKNSDLVKNRENTYLTAAASAAGTTLTVKAVDSNAWADNDYIIVGEIGSKNAELMQINGAVTDGTSLTIDRSGSSSLRYDHAIDEPVYRIDFDKVEFSRYATDVDPTVTTPTVLATNEIQPDDYETRYDDQVNATGFAYVRFKNTTTSGFSPYSDAIPYAGQTDRSLNFMVTKVRKLINEETDAEVSDDDIIDGINAYNKDIYHERLWTFAEVTKSLSRVANQHAYTLPSTVKDIHTADVRTVPLIKVSQARWRMLYWNSDQTASTQTHASIWDGELLVYPRPSSAAASTTLGAAISTAAATTVTVVATSTFKRGDYFRFIVDSEVIYATSSTSTTFTGCLRGQEGTTATTHSNGATVTERDIVYTAQEEPAVLVLSNDETAIPEPLVVCHGAASDIAGSILKDMGLHDRLLVKYDKGMVNLRNRYTLKLTSQLGRVKDPKEVMTDDGRFEDPNRYPTGVTEA